MQSSAQPCVHKFQRSLGVFAAPRVPPSSCTTVAEANGDDPHRQTCGFHKIFNPNHCGHILWPSSWGGGAGWVDESALMCGPA